MKSPETTPAAIFARAMEFSPGPLRTTYLDESCGIGTPLRNDVEALIQMEEDPTGFFAPQNTGAKTRFASGIHEPEGNRIGRYKLLQRIGEGGCGIVYLAEQTSPVRRKVALKIIKLGLDSRSVVARFEAERQALALMDHPNIARVLDAGATEIGRPYFVMELVRGTKITTYCDENQLSIQDRLSLFIQVCQAVQHAHQKGIIHRDLKPSNILVTIRDGVAPIPKVIDFGIAKATGDLRLTDKTLFTQMEILVGTPAYMSPEQADLNASDIDTRSDIYSLGVLLYELLTGRPPFDADVLATSGIDAMRKTIREQEPIAPSTRISSLFGKDLTDLAQRHASYAPRLISMVRGDLDWIVLKALEKDRNRRYQTASALANDVERYLRDELVAARPPSQSYRLGKMIRRHRVMFGATAAVLTSLIAGLSIAVWQYSEKSAALLRESIAKEERLKEYADAVARAYASEIRLIQDALVANNFGRARSLLQSQVQSTNTLILRGWEWRHMWDLSQSDPHFELVSRHPVPNPICGLSLSADGRHLATTEHGHGDIMLWDVLERKPATHLSHNPHNALVEFSPTAPLLAFTTEIVVGDTHQCGVSFWNVRESQAIRSLSLPDRCKGLAFSADGSQLLTLTGNATREYTVWNVRDGSPAIRKPAPPLAGTIGTPFAANTTLSQIACGLDGGRIQLIESSTARVLWEITRPNAFVDSIALSPDGTTVAVGFRKSVPWIELFATDSGVSKLRLDCPTGYPIDLLFTSDSQSLWSAHSDQIIRRWKLADGSPERTLHGHRMEVWRLDMLTDQRSLVSGSKDGQLLVWDTAAPKLNRDPLRIPNVAWHGWRFTTNSSAIITCDANGVVRKLTGSQFEIHQPLVDVGNNPFDVLLEDHGRQIATSDSTGNVTVWDLQTRKPRIEFSTGPTPVHFWNFTRNGNGLVVIHGKDSTLREWDLVTGHVLPSAPSDSDWHVRGSFPVSRHFLSKGWSAPLPTAENASEAKPGERNLKALDGALSPDGKWLAFGHHQGSVQVIDPITRHSIMDLRGIMHAVHSVAFSPDGLRIVAGSDGREGVRMWDTATRQELITLGVEGVSMFMTAFSPDGNWLGSLSGNGELYLWRASSWDEIAVLPGRK